MAKKAKKALKRVEDVAQKIVKTILSGKNTLKLLSELRYQTDPKQTLGIVQEIIQDPKVLKKVRKLLVQGGLIVETFKQKKTKVSTEPVYSGPPDSDFPDVKSIRDFWKTQNMTPGQAVSLAGYGMTPGQVFYMTEKEMRRPRISTGTIEKLMASKKKFTA